MGGVGPSTNDLGTDRRSGLLLAREDSRQSSSSSTSPFDSTHAPTPYNTHHTLPAFTTPLTATPTCFTTTLEATIPEEIASHRERGLCFNCKEKFHRGHRCAFRLFLPIADEDNPALSNISILDPPDTPPPDPPDSTYLYPTQISLNSLVVHLTPETIRLVGHLDDHRLLLLVDGGSTHNFIQQQLVTQLGLSCRATTPLRVMVGNGQYLECQSMCEAISITIQDIPFTIDLHVLPISGTNIVLGV